MEAEPAVHRGPILSRKILSDRTRIIRSARNLKGMEYCKALDRDGLKLNPAWGDCPKKTYAEAYRLPKWKQRIHEEKSRHTRITARKSKRQRAVLAEKLLTH